MFIYSELVKNVPIWIINKLNLNLKFDIEIFLHGLTIIKI